MRNKDYHIYLTDMEYHHIIQSLINMKNELIEQGRYTDAVDDVLCKFVSAKKKKVRVAAFVYQKRCVEGLTIEEIMKNTRLTREQLNMFVRYFDARQKAVTNEETDAGSIDQTKFH